MTKKDEKKNPRTTMKVRATKKAAHMTPGMEYEVAESAGQHLIDKGFAEKVSVEIPKQVNT